METARPIRPEAERLGHEQPIECWYSFIGAIDIATARADEVEIWGAPVALATLGAETAEEPAAVG